MTIIRFQRYRDIILRKLAFDLQRHLLVPSARYALRSCSYRNPRRRLLHLRSTLGRELDSLMRETASKRTDRSLQEYQLGRGFIWKHAAGR